MLKGLLKGNSIKSVVDRLALPYALDTLYHVLHRLRARLTAVRSLLSRERPAPESSQTDPLLQTVEHLRCLFPEAKFLLVAFQLHFQCPFLQ